MLRLRRFPRYHMDGKVCVLWQGEKGEPWYTNCRLMDISAEGMQVESLYPMPLRHVVQFQFEGVLFEGSASVRSCVRKGIKYRLGLEFCGGLRWRFPAEVAEKAGMPPKATSVPA